MDKRKKTHPILVASILRIFATILIFVFHYRGLSKLPNDIPIDKIGITTFLLLSGYFSFQPNIPPASWLIKRIKQIMIPYWSVISIVLLVNEIVGYKTTDFFTAIIIFFGGSLFVKDPVYVISWFITYILILYICLFIYLLIDNIFLKLVFIVFSAICLNFAGIKNYLYFFSFYAGYFVHAFFKLNFNGTSNKLLNKINYILYQIQGHSYSFFLLHGAILKLVFGVFMFRGTMAFMISFLMTSTVSIFHKIISEKIEKFLEYYENKIVTRISHP
ncbi:acyltransferase family protein [Desulfonatronum lacustre]|uniref:acyltransferase family protein n=1 Tax=Desulfonatronum lacustre TaxID=66849 RepID=UPI00049155EB|nr:acyltransferase family protein [Desulfonatronum lacustre]